MAPQGIHLFIVSSTHWGFAGVRVQWRRHRLPSVGVGTVSTTLGQSMWNQNPGGPGAQANLDSPMPPSDDSLNSGLNLKCKSIHFQEGEEAYWGGAAVFFPRPVNRTRKTVLNPTHKKPSMGIFQALECNACFVFLGWAAPVWKPGSCPWLLWLCFSLSFLLCGCSGFLSL